MKNFAFLTLVFTMFFVSCTSRGCESWSRGWERRTEESNYAIEYYGLFGDKLKFQDNFKGFLHNDEGIDIWYYKGDTVVQIMRGDFGTTIVKSWH